MTDVTGIYHTSYNGEAALFPTVATRMRLVLAVAALVMAPFLASPFWLTVLNQSAVAVVGALGLNLLVGYTGQISLGQGGFLAVGAYTSGLLVTRLGLPTVVSIVLAVLVAAVVGALFGLPALRLKALYLAIATLAAQFVILFVVRNYGTLGGVGDSLVVPTPEVFGFSFRSAFRWYWLLVGVAALCTFAVRNLFRTGIGRAFMAIRDHDIAAEAIGVNLLSYKVIAFAVSSGLAGLAGALIAHSRSIVTWERFTLEVSILYLAMIIIGGLGSIRGTLMGAVFMTFVPAALTQIGQSARTTFPVLIEKLPAIQLVLFGVIIVGFLLVEPRGLAHLWDRTKAYFRLWPFKY